MWNKGLGITCACLIALSMPSLAYKPVLKQYAQVPPIMVVTAQGQACELYKEPDSAPLLTCFTTINPKELVRNLSFLKKLQYYMQNRLKVIIVAEGQPESALVPWLHLEKAGLRLLADPDSNAVTPFQLFVLPTLVLTDPKGNLLQLYVDLNVEQQKKILADINAQFHLELPEAQIITKPALF